MARLQGLVTLDADGRKHSNGRLREEEEDAMLAILDAADSRPDLFQELADKDGGTLLSYNVEAQIGGKLAQLGQRLINGSAKKLADEFFANFAKAVQG